ncbi:hypothetical protein [Pseudonocardia sp. GCM10023141]|uniref:hypothetical protein n=1 Tax=Pseudonocardia sp. GCM10023141 TaxID=3252653 RepID=UPI00360BB644
MSVSDESERRLAEALRARATGAGRPGPALPRQAPPAAASRSAAVPGPTTRMILLIALLVGAVLGAALALLSMLAPGLLPAFG